MRSAIDRPLSDSFAANQEKLLDAYAQLITRLRRSGDMESEDIIQEACIRALKLPRPDLIQNPFRYLLKIYRNLFVNHQLAKAREASLFDRSIDATAIEQMSSSYIDSERILIGREELIIAFLAIESLPQRYRQAFKLRRLENLSYAAIAEQMGITPKTVENYLAYAVIRLTNALSVRREEFLASQRSWEK